MPTPVASNLRLPFVINKAIPNPCQIKGLTIAKSPHLSLGTIISASLCECVPACSSFLWKPPIVTAAIRASKGSCAASCSPQIDRSLVLLASFFFSSTFSQVLYGVQINLFFVAVILMLSCSSSSVYIFQSIIRLIILCSLNL